MIYGILWLLLGVTSLLFSPDNIINYVFLIFGILYFGTFLFENKKQYLTIEKGVITKNKLIPEKIKLNEITQLKKLPGEYILKTDSSELRINTELIEEKSLQELNAVLDKLNLQAK